MRFLSVCSGIEAASVAWESLGWKAVGFSEIEPFPCAVLAHRFPNTPNYGSLTEYQKWPVGPGTADILVGGCPCQSFSVAGLRRGMQDPRGNLTLTYLGLADKVKPKWIVYENVPGLLSSNGGRDFGAFLGALVQLGYGFAYRVLDAQHFGVPQRRRRVFVVACLGAGGWESAAKVLFEPESLSGDTAKGRKKGQGVASDAQGGSGASGLPDTVGTLCADTHPGAYTGQDAYTGRLIPSQAPADSVPFRKSKRAQSTTDDKSWVEAAEANTLNNFDLGDTRTTHAVVSPTITTCKGSRGGSSSEAIDEITAIHLAQASVAPHIVQASELRLRGEITPQETCPTLLAQTKSGDNDALAVHAITFQTGNLRSEAGANSQGVDLYNQTLTGDIHVPLRTAGGHGAPAALQAMAVRRLTPTECMRLQGFPDDWARIPWKGKPADQCPDGPQYKAAGNSMAVPVMRWIGSRIATVEQLSTQHTK